MKDKSYPFDLVVLVADNTMNISIKTLLDRPQALNIKEIRYDIFTHIGRDPGCFNKGHDFISSYVNTYHHAMIIFDREGCGQEYQTTREELEKMVEHKLEINGWNNRAAAIVIDPELENWLWSDSPEVEQALGWRGKNRHSVYG